MRAGTALLICGIAIGVAGAKPAEPGPDGRAQAVFDRTKRTQATYALYSWNWVKGSGYDGAPRWSAEFHQGHLHRVETPQVRLVADCAAGTGSLLNVDTGRLESSEAIARAACGINSNFPLRSLEWLGRSDSRFGAVETVRILDPADERIYVVDDSGVLVAAEIFPRDPAGTYCVQQEPLAVERALPAAEMFTVDSLNRSFAAEMFRSPPHAAVGDLWLGSRRCV